MYEQTGLQFKPSIDIVAGAIAHPLIPPTPRICRSVCSGPPADREYGDATIAYQGLIVLLIRLRNRSSRVTILQPGVLHEYTMAEHQAEVILFHYKESINSHRVVWYLQLNGIRYSECIQPGWMPRPDITEDLGIGYRKIPILAIGKDVYCDSRRILDVLEEKYSTPSAKLQEPSEQGLRKIFESFNMHSGLFWRAATLLPMWRHPFLKDPRFIQDRSEMVGRPFDAETLKKGRPEALAYMRMAYDLMETTFLADGRQWILNTAQGPTLADIDAVFILQWLVRDELMEESIPQDQISAEKFPKTFAWIDRFLAAVAKAKQKAPEPLKLSKTEATAKILNGRASRIVPHVDLEEPLGLKLGDTVSVTPDDVGSSHSAIGRLLRLTKNDLCIVNEKSLQLHFPRWGFTIRKIEVPPGDNEVAASMEKGDGYKMNLIYHPMSPFSRSVYMFAIELGLEQSIALEKVVVAPVPYEGWSDNNDRVAEFNPVGKIPVLVPEAHEDGIYDSRTIMEYLAEASKTRPTESADHKHKWRLRTLLALANGLLDAHTLIVYENKIRAERGIKFETWVEGQKEKINRALDRLEIEAARGTLRNLRVDEIATAADVTVAAALAFSDITQHEWRKARPQLSKWFAGWEQRTSFTRTMPDVDWKTGEASRDEFASGVVVGK